MDQFLKEKQERTLRYFQMKEQLQARDRQISELNHEVQTLGLELDEALALIDELKANAHYSASKVEELEAEIGIVSEHGANLMHQNQQLRKENEELKKALEIESIALERACVVIEKLTCGEF